MDAIPDIIEADFDQGTVYQRVNVTWSGLKLRMESNVMLGMPHGMFKVEAIDETGQRRWMVGSMKRGRIHGECWTILGSMASPKQVKKV